MRFFPAALGSALSARSAAVQRPSSQQHNSVAASRRADANFFDLPCEALARRLLGQVLVRKLEQDEELRAQIVETECYPGAPDRASHSCVVRRVTPRTAPLYAQPGTCAVTRVYGTHRCLSISSRGDGACVLLRALEPLQGCARMLAHRCADSAARGKTAHEPHPHRACSGPGKLCAAMRIDEDSFHGQPLWTSPWLWLEPTEPATWAVVRAPRVGVAFAGLRWATAPLRFYLTRSRAVSVRDEAAERGVRDVERLCKRGDRASATSS